MKILVAVFSLGSLTFEFQIFYILLSVGDSSFRVILMCYCNIIRKLDIQLSGLGQRQHINALGPAL